jgi:hypothetical protein
MGASSRDHVYCSEKQVAPFDDAEEQITMADTPDPAPQPARRGGDVLVCITLGALAVAFTFGLIRFGLIRSSLIPSQGNPSRDDYMAIFVLVAFYVWIGVTAVDYLAARRQDPDTFAASVTCRA